MKRQITIYESARNGKITVLNDVECGTLGELKGLLRENGIDYENKEFVEGVTNTKLLSDDSQIPTNIPFKNSITNDVFINILNKDTKIKSGVNYSELSRGELLRAAKPYAQEIEKEFHANYTRVKSTDIVSFLTKKEEKPKTAEPAAEEAVESKTEEKCECGVEKKLEMLKEAVEYLAESTGSVQKVSEILKDWNSVPVAEKKEAPAVKEKPKSNFSDEDINGFLRRKR